MRFEFHLESLGNGSFEVNLGESRPISVAAIAIREEFCWNFECETRVSDAIGPSEKPRTALRPGDPEDGPSWIEFPTAYYCVLSRH